MVNLIVNATNGINGAGFSFGQMQDLDFDNPQTATSTPTFIKINFDGGLSVELTGSGFGFDLGGVTGTATELVLLQDGSPVVTLSDFSIAAQTVYDLVQSGDYLMMATIMSATADTMTGSQQADTLLGYSGDDTLSGLGGDDILVGDDGNDVLIGGDGNDTLVGVAGNDVLRGGLGADRLIGYNLTDGPGNDTASYYTSGTRILVSLATGLGSGGEAQGDTLSGIENLSGSQGSDSLYGNAGANILQGWGGNDELVGRNGKDTLAGGAGADRFVYTTTAESVVGVYADRITDFSHAQGDRIDLSAIDANTGTAGNQAFGFIVTGLYTGVAGQLRYHSDGAVTGIGGDVDGDGVSDFHIQLTGAIGLVAGDFVL